MAEQQITAELTVRDVLGQVDRRLTLIEGDLRDLRTVLDTQTAEIRTEVKNEIGGFRSEEKNDIAGVRGEINGLRSEMNGLRSEMSVKFRWLTGIVLASWLSVMGTLLLK